MNILAIESTCDETAVAIVRNGREVLCDCIASQVALHREYGGVVPEIASRKHIEAISALADQALLAGHPVRIADGRGVLSIHSTRQFEEMRTALAHLRFDSDIPPEAVLDACAREGNAGLLYVVSGQCGQTLVEPMRGLSFGSCALIHIGTEAPEGFTLPCYAVKDEKQLQAVMGGAA